MNKVLATSLLTGVAILSFSSIASAYEPGWYLGGQLGWTKQYTQLNNSTSSININNFKSITSSNSSRTSSGLGGSILGGYLFNDYFAGELGYVYFHNVSNNTKVVGTNPFPPNQGLPLNGTANAYVKEQVFDLLAKAMYPFGDSGFDVFAKAGIAVLDSKQSLDTSTTVASNNPLGNAYGFVNTTNWYNVNNTHKPIRPAYGLGMGYDINDNWTTTVTWLRVQGKGGSGANVTPSANLAAIGFDYYFGT